MPQKFGKCKEQTPEGGLLRNKLHVKLLEILNAEH